MKPVLDRLLDKIREAQIDPMPSDNIYMEDVFEPKIYSEILARLPADENYDYIDHPDAILPDGTKTRKLLDLTDQTIQALKPSDRDFWLEFKSILTSASL